MSLIYITPKDSCLFKNLGIAACTTPKPIKSNAPPSGEPTIIPYDK